MAAQDEGSTETAIDEEPVFLSGPTEPIVTTDDHGDDVVKLLEPRSDGAASVIELGSWVCELCQTRNTIDEGDPTNPPSECKGCERQGPFYHRGEPEDWDDDSPSVVDLAVRAKKMWYPPSSISDDNYDELWSDVREYIRDHWDAGDDDDADAIYDGLTAYALSTWVRENLTFLPHLMLRGHTTGGKTRLLNTLARVSYRAIVSASATPASMYRLVDSYNASYFISEYHGLDRDSRLELDNIVRAGQKKGEVVTRAEPSQNGYEPMVYDPFTHAAIATQYEPKDDIVNRCIQVKSSTSTRDMPAVHDETQAESIRNRLLYARYRLLHSDEWERAEVEAYEYLADRDITGRTREKLLSGVTMAILWDCLDSFGAFVDLIAEQDQIASAESEDALFVEAVKDLAFDKIGSRTDVDGDPFAAITIPYSEITDRYEEITGVEKNASWAGHIVKRLGFEKARKRNGTVIEDPDLGDKLRSKCEHFNLDWERLDGDRVVEVDDGHKATCPDCGEKVWLEFRDTVTQEPLCTDCADVRRDEYDNGDDE